MLDLLLLKLLLQRLLQGVLRWRRCPLRLLQRLLLLGLRR